MNNIVNIGKESLGKEMMSESKFFMGYSRWDEDLDRYEGWDESVKRVMDMHREKYKDQIEKNPYLESLILFAENYYGGKDCLGSQRSLQFGGQQIFKHEARMYNCASTYADRIEFFQEAMYLLLCGCGVGFSVQSHHVAKLPQIRNPDIYNVKTFVVEDSIEGWADAFGALLSSFTGKGSFDAYDGLTLHFDYSQVRPRGANISGGFKAPGPDGLRASLEKCRELLRNNTGAFKSIVAYDFTMHMADAVLSGGVRRSATICLFSKEDAEMMKAKTGDWFYDNPQRGRSNNSVVLVRDELSKEEFSSIMDSVKYFGEPGFILTDSTEFTYNPCVEIGMLPVCQVTKETGFQMCNLTEINGGAIKSVQDLMDACKAASILGTLQAGYTNFKYLSNATTRITEREALLGVSITGWMNSPDILFDEENMKNGAEYVRQYNRLVASLIDINPAARTTCVKPSGNASVLLGTASGIHGEHSPNYFRNVQMSYLDEVTQLIMKHNPEMVEKSVWGADDAIVSFPVTSDPDSIFKIDLLGIKQLEYVKKAQEAWVEYGTDLSLCTDQKLRHNVSNTITVDDWQEVEGYIYENRYSFAGISLLASSGDKAYVQAPFSEVITCPTELVDLYGKASLFASGLIVDGLTAFNNNLWKACDCVLMKEIELDQGTHAIMVQKDWIRRAKKFSDNFFQGDYQLMTNCLKDVHNCHRWNNIQRNIKPIDFASELKTMAVQEASELGAQACSGGGCELEF